MNIKEQNEIRAKLYDKDFRKMLLKNSGEYFKNSNYDVNVTKNTKDTIYVVIPSSELSESDLTNVDAAGSTLSVGTAFCVGSISSTAGSASTASSAIIITGPLPSTAAGGDTGA